MHFKPARTGGLNGFDHAEHSDFFRALGTEHCLVFETLKETLAIGIGNIRAASPCVEKDLEIGMHQWAALFMQSRSS